MPLQNTQCCGHCQRLDAWDRTAQLKPKARHLGAARQTHQWCQHSPDFLTRFATVHSTAAAHPPTSKCREFKPARVEREDSQIILILTWPKSRLPENIRQRERPGATFNRFLRNEGGPSSRSSPVHTLTTLTFGAPLTSALFSDQTRLPEGARPASVKIYRLHVSPW